MNFKVTLQSLIIVGYNLVQDLLSRLFSKSRPHSYEESIQNITSALNGLKFLKAKKLKRNLTDVQIETILKQCLPSDQSEFFKDWAKEKSINILRSTVIYAVEEGPMETKREFL